MMERPIYVLLFDQDGGCWGPSCETCRGHIIFKFLYDRDARMALDYTRDFMVFNQNENLDSIIVPKSIVETLEVMLAGAINGQEPPSGFSEFQYEEITGLDYAQLRPLLDWLPTIIDSPDSSKREQLVIDLKRVICELGYLG